MKPGARRSKKPMRTPTDDFTPIEDAARDSVETLTLIANHYAIDIEDAALFWEIALRLPETPGRHRRRRTANGADRSQELPPEVKKKP